MTLVQECLYRPLFRSIELLVRPVHYLVLHAFMHITFADTPGSIDRVKIGFVDSTDSQFSYVNNESDTTIYPGMILCHSKLYFRYCETCQTTCIYILKGPPLCKTTWSCPNSVKRPLPYYIRPLFCGPDRHRLVSLYMYIAIQ